MLRSIKPGVGLSLRAFSISSLSYSCSSLSVDIKLPNGIKYKQPTGLFIGNEFVKSKQEKTFEVINPSIDEVITSVYEAKEDDTELAIDAARLAFQGGWPTCDPMIRSSAINKLADLVEENKEVIAGIESLDNGKALPLACKDVDFAIQCLRFSETLAQYPFGRVINGGPNSLNYTRREPIGKIGPALVTGNSVVLKPAECTPLTALYVSQFIKEAGIPSGVYNLVSGLGTTVGEYLSRSPKVDKVAFTGSTATGKRILQNAADTNLKKVTLELGGKSPNIVFEDCDIESTVKNIIFSIYVNAGQVCCAGSRLFVQEGIKDKLVDKSIQAISQLKVGDPFEEGTFQGPISSRKQFDKVMKYIELGKQEGAKVLIGGERHGDRGFFIKPTIFTSTTHKMKIVKGEIFGPVLVLDTFKTIDEVVAKANDTDYGLAAGAHTANLKNAIDVTNKLRAGTVWINTYNDNHYNLPFGGYKYSGFGRELGFEVVDNYTQIKAVRMKF
ncbi:hypothetical protein DASC09_008430 [Saccharomycopsis crataegensis]|uniref:Aldehyde dehydrogenase domain-containing protein n=1 Tax=Saccharomycopsis crataegensis TaxID=43959 RepID=A0AAV5QFK9_9ASCO|nr:hypothetical protein DASC09_008430 [Saccharomycopsis crataegensis]